MENNIPEILTKLGIEDTGGYQNDKYVIELSNSNEFSKMYTLLDNSEEVEINEFATLITDKVSEMQFEGEGYVVRLVGNFTTDLYKIVIKEEN